jgi:hypothetical protein
MKLAQKVVKTESNIIISLPSSKSEKLTVEKEKSPHDGQSLKCKKCYEKSTKQNLCEVHDQGINLSV